MPNARATTTVAAITTSGLTKRFGRLAALDDVSIDVQPGEVYGFLGPNGAGKTTTIRLLLGLAHASAGTAQVFGHDCWADTQAAHRHLAYVPGEVSVWPTLRGREMLDLLGSVHGGYDRSRLDDLCDRFDFDPSTKGRDYSRGNRQKIGLIAAFMVRPDLLVLDEPTTGLDPLMELTFRHCVEEARANGQTIFLSSHILSEVDAVCDRVAILRHGRLVEVATLDALRKLNARDVVIEFSGLVPELAGVSGIADIAVDGTTVRFHLRGEPTDMLAAIAGSTVRSLDIREPSLEELFLSFYDDVDTEHDAVEEGQA